MELLGRYQPLFVIGRGGMGTIEVAIERGVTDADGRVVALKRMLPGVRDRRHADMFMREARLATLLNHDNVVHAFAFGEEDGELIIAMEYVEGETLAGLLSHLASGGKRLPIEVATYVLAELCDGLHAAHELKDVTGAALGVVHRDVSPQNVMLSYTGHVKLLDFGVAKLESAQLTKTGEVKGKTAYMSPEQAMGESLDRRSDLYGVGAILFELVAGRRMWSGESDLEHLRQLALAEPPTLESAAPEAPRALRELHARLVAKKPKDRPATAAEVASALRATLHSGDESRRALERMLQEVYADAIREKRQKLEAAIGAPPESSGVAVSETARTPSRAAPWMYAIVGAAVASVAVFALARNKPQTPSAVPTMSVSATTSASVAPAREPVVTAPSATTVVEAPATHAPTTQTQTPSQPQRPRTTPPTTRPTAPPAITTTAQPTPTAPPTHPAIDVDPHPI